jgi:hypothetical protein
MKPVNNRTCKLVFTFLTVFGTANLATAQESKEAAAEANYMLCVRRAAIRFEPSEESPQSIAEAATWACLGEETKADNLLLNDPRPGITPMGLHESAEFTAVGQVVGVRLCKKTKDCAYAHVP